MKKQLNLFSLLVLLSCNEQTLQYNHTAQIESKDIVYEKNKLWDNESTLKVLFTHGSKEDTEKVAKIASEWTKYANLDFEFYHYDELSDYNANIKVAVKDPTCIGNSSYIGTDSEHTYIKKSMCLSNLDRNTVLHEFGHALGLSHEHLFLRLDDKLKDEIIDECIEVNQWDRATCEINYFGIRKGMIFREYDQHSVMHYSFHKEKYKDNVNHKEHSTYGKLPFLSLEDRYQISSLYPGRAIRSEIIADYKSDLEKHKTRNKCIIIDSSNKDSYRKKIDRAPTCSTNKPFELLKLIQSTGFNNEILEYWTSFENACFETQLAAIKYMWISYNCKQD